MESKKKTIARNCVIFLIIILPVIWHIMIVYSYARNIPQYDDFAIALQFLTWVKATPLKALFALHNEHRLAVPRSIVYLTYKIVGSSNIEILTYITNIYILLLLVTIYVNFRKMRLSLWLFIPASLTVINPYNWENMIWVTSGLQHFGIVAMATGAFTLFASKNQILRFCGIFLSIAAVYTSLSGLLVPIFLFIWSFNRYRSGKDKLILIPVLTAIISSICFITYVVGYSRPTHHPELLWSLHHFLEALSHFLIHAGGIIRYPLFSWLLGATLFLITIYLTFRKIWRKSPVFYNTLVFLLANAGMISIGRAKFSITQGLTDRYSLYSLMIFLCIYMLLLALNINKPRAQIALGSIALVFTVFIFVNSYSDSMAKLRERDKMLTEGIYEWSQTGKGLYFPDPVRAGKILYQMVENGIYILPDDIRINPDRTDLDVWVRQQEKKN